ncbi:L-iditol 2-dehydrogenase [Paraburkholderia caballeronis]|uniref:D-sorbitol dehydrogenase (Acceptor) n=1 Tax=Paraburkholderia caballeronis TaxID=416943 RepID=A0A1H7PQD5_9BURK|nr:L-iditol 2-dehydrogenase [Paraburkholderia caballeronis]PXW24292.1 D-sorbitol dehydrogenase (acceptor) [Paraburkholderia caballeronis]PXX00074.1 D-sorbitol dehydrogenase (acceptor) [Paraburkholderia caballeronis]RAJ97203.1 D-sorbitol dehydrogenase (acceptor) [Paraburkholderia caballeronis]SEB69752.1 D-sorbitol dehydrogenase (acceptor) [Paraburkholderia caballeronis]SEL38050.1 D-sorbitol dehydrogenase (acceptor) [Paraburkholderia caballeronis]
MAQHPAAGRLQDKVALLTGAASGIGEAVARRYLDEGARCALVDVKPADGIAPQLAAAYPGRVLALGADVTRRDDIERIVGTTVERFGRIDILFNNAALFDMRPLLDESWDVYDRLFSVNVKGMFFLMQTAARRMVEQGGGGKIVNMASQAGRRGEALVAHYCATKAAVLSYTQSAALALAPHRINVNGIAPGVVDTPMWEEVDALFARYEHRPVGEKKRLVGEAVPLGRMGVPADLTGAAVFLASADADYITAQTLNVDGGNWMN